MSQKTYAMMRQRTGGMRITCCTCTRPGCPGGLSCAQIMIRELARGVRDSHREDFLRLLVARAAELRHGRCSMCEHRHLDPSGQLGCAWCRCGHPLECGCVGCEEDRECGWIRAGGDVVCERCGFEYREHPISAKVEWLHLICGGLRVKL